MTNSTTNTGAKPRTTTDDARYAAEDVAHSARDAAMDAAESAKTHVKGRADAAQGVAADEVKNFSSALRTAAEEMRDGSPQARTFSQIADGLADASEQIRDKDLGEIVGDLSDFARRNPMVFLGGAALVGFAATRFAKATATPTYPSSSVTMADVTARPGSAYPASPTGFEAPRPVGTPPSASPLASPAVATTSSNKTGDL